MTNRWLVGLFTASMLTLACEGEGDSVDALDDALIGDFDTAEHRVLPDGGVAAGGGRGGCRGARPGRGRRGSPGHGGGPGHQHDGGMRANDRDVDQDEAADEAADADDRRQRGADHDGGMRGRGDDRCANGPGGGRDRDGGPGRGPGRPGDGGIPTGPGPRGPRRDAGPQPGPGDVASTVTLPDGTTVRLDPSCPAIARGGFRLPGCCLPRNTCGLSTHLIDVNGVPKGCQDYAQARQVDPSFPLADKACTF